MHYLCKVFFFGFLLRSSFFSIAMVFGSNSIYLLDINLCKPRSFGVCDFVKMRSPNTRRYGSDVGIVRRLMMCRLHYVQVIST